MKTETPLLSSTYTALILKLTGILLTLSAIVNAILAIVPPNFQDSEWLSGVITTWVNQGTLPMLGMALLLWGLWIDGSGQTRQGRSSLLMGTIVLSVVLGLLFLVLTPVYFNSTRLVSAAKTRDVNEQTAQTESQLDVLLERQRQQVSAIISNPEQFDQLQQEIDSAKIPDEQKAQLKQLQTSLQQVKNNPKLLDQKVQEARTQGLSRIRQRQQQTLDQATATIRKSRIQIISAGILLTIGYCAIVWTVLTSAPKKTRAKKARAR